MKAKEYWVEILTHSIHMEPKVQPTDKEMKARADKPVKISNRAAVYAWPNDKIDVMFKDKMKLREPTLRVIAKFPFCTVMQSENRFNVYYSFGKEELKLFERELLLNREFVMDTLYAAITSRRQGESEEELRERIEEIKRKGDFV